MTPNSEHHRTVLATFDRDADEGHAAHHEELFGDIARQVLDSMTVRPGQQLLELGCGNGWATKRMGQKAPGAQAIGIDLSPRMIALADASTDWTSRARFERCAMEDLDLPDDRFDHALAIGSLELAADTGAALAQAKRVLKAGGRLHLVVVAHAGTPLGATLRSTIGIAPPDHDAAAWTALLETAGFSGITATERADSRGAEGRPRFERTPWTPDEAAHEALLGATFLHIEAEA